MPKCSPIATACVSSPKDWAVLIGSHMQQEVVSFGAPTSRRTCPHLDCASTERQNTNCNNFTSGNHVRGARFNAYVASARHCTTEAMVSKLAIITPHTSKLLAHACETRVLRPAGRPGQTIYKVDGAERASFSRTDVQTNKWYTRTPFVNSADARPRTFSSTRHEKEMSGADGEAEHQTNQQLSKRVVNNNKNDRTVTS